MRTYSVGANSSHTGSAVKRKTCGPSVEIRLDTKARAGLLIHWFSDWLSDCLFHWLID